MGYFALDVQVFCVGIEDERGAIRVRDLGAFYLTGVLESHVPLLSDVAPRSIIPILPITRQQLASCIAGRDRCPQFFQFGFEKMIGDGQRLHRLMAAATSSIGIIPSTLLNRFLDR